jgi:hypothetical protein
MNRSKNVGDFAVKVLICVLALTLVPGPPEFLLNVATALLAKALSQTSKGSRLLASFRYPTLRRSI